MKNKIILLIALLMMTFIFSGCGDKQIIRVEDWEAREICDMMEVECEKTQETTESVVLTKNKKSLNINLPVTSCREIEVHSIKQEGDKLMVNLLETGLSCSEGGSFKGMLVNFKNKVDIAPENVEVTKYIEAKEGKEEDEDHGTYIKISQ